MAHCLFYLEIQAALQHRKVSILPCGANYPAYWQTGVSVSLNSSRPGDPTVMSVGSTMLSLFLACLNTASECALMGKGASKVNFCQAFTAPKFCPPKTCQQSQCNFVSVYVSVCVCFTADRLSYVLHHYFSVEHTLSFLWSISEPPY